ncbi:hypothetical protein D3C75_912630 [compost metagenome]
MQALDALQQALAQQADFFTVCRGGVEYRLVGVVAQQAFEVVVLAGAAVQQQYIARRQQQKHADTGQQAMQRGKAQGATDGPDQEDRQEERHSQQVGLVAQAVVLELVHTGVASSASTNWSMTCSRGRS